MLDHAEQIVKGKKNKKGWLGIFLAFIIAVILSSVAIRFMGWPAFFLTVLLFVLFCFIGFNLYKMMNIEWEYSVYEGSLEITSIKGQRSRKKVFECQVKEIGSFNKISKEEIKEAMKMSAGEEIRLDCTDSLNENDSYVITAKNSDGRLYRVFISPEGKLLEILKQDSFEIRRYFMKNGN